MPFADQGNGTYANPVLLCDYSDPDAIRVGDTYYLTASSFNYTPGLPILTSKDLVNWTLVNYALQELPGTQFCIPQHAKGVWAPAIRWHEGWFYIFFGMPDEGIFMVRTRDPLGPWEAPVCVLAGKGLIDPCPFWDEDGSAWVVHGYAKSRIGFNSVLGIFPMSVDGMQATGEDLILFDGHKTQPTIEGPKVYRRDGWIYIFAPAGGVEKGWQTVLRARTIRGPWEERIVLAQGSSEVNGPHQGAWVDTPDGQGWFLHFQSRGLYGRIVHLQPMRWLEDGWPFIGMADPKQTNPYCGMPVATWEKPHAPVCERTRERASDDFNGLLGLQWQFMANNRPDFYEVGGGKLKLNAAALPEGGRTLWMCPQVLTQKISALSLEARVTLDASHLRCGEQAGLVMIGGEYAAVIVRMTASGRRICWMTSGQQELCQEIGDAPEQIELRLSLRQTGYAAAETHFSWRTPDGAWQSIGEAFAPGRHTWVGARIGLAAMPYDGGSHGGYALFGAFEVTEIEA